MSQRGFVAVPPLVDWPRDEAAHDGLPWEIWWITSDVRSGDRRLSAHLMLVHLGAGRMTATVAVTDLDREEERSTRIAAEPNQVDLSADHLAVVTTVGSFEGSYAGGYRVRGQVDESAAFDIELRPTAPVLFSAGAGQFTLGAVTTTQYSIGGMEATGTLRTEGETLSVVGHAWYDRQWIHSGQLADIGGAFTWFGICLDNGDTLSLWDTSTRAEGGRTWATIVRPDGTHIVTAAEPVADQATDFCSTPRGHHVPRRWKLVIPAMGAELDVTQRLVQDAPGFYFYTGALDVSGSYDAGSVSGYGFCDLVGWPQ